MAPARMRAESGAGQGNLVACSPSERTATLVVACRMVARHATSGGSSRLAGGVTTSMVMETSGLKRSRRGVVIVGKLEEGATFVRKDWGSDPMAAA